MSIASVILRGFGNGTVSGSTSGVILRGYTQGEAVDVTVTGPALGVSSKVKLNVGLNSKVGLNVGVNGKVKLNVGVDGGIN
jgi:hypothetical protein